MRSKLPLWLLTASLLAVSATPALAAGQGWLGVTTQATDEDLRRGLDLTRDGLLVNRVSADSPADQAGLKKGDVILTYNSRAVADPEDLRQLVRDTEPGHTVSLGVWRDGARRTLEVEVGELPASEGEMFDVPVPRMAPAPSAPSAPRAPRAPRAPESPRELSEEEMQDKLKEMEIEGFEGMNKLKDLKGLEGMQGWSSDDGRTFGFSSMGRGRLGVRVEKLSDDLAQALGSTGDQGVLVVEVIEDTPAQKAGVRAGDVIVRVGGETVSDPDGLVKVLRAQDGRVDIVLLRRGQRRTIQADLESRSTTRSRPSGPGARRFNARIPEPGKAPQVYRWRAKDEAGNEDLREELRQLRRELKELREQMREKR